MTLTTQIAALPVSDDVKRELLDAVAAEIEACAQIAHKAGLAGPLGDWDRGWNHAAVSIGQRIRARLPTKGQDHE